MQGIAEVEPWTRDEDGNAMLFVSAAQIEEIERRIRKEEEEAAEEWDSLHPAEPDDWREQAERANAEHDAIAAAERHSIEESRQ